MEGFEMGKVKVLTARQAADLIKDGDTVTLSGFVANGIAEAFGGGPDQRRKCFGSIADNAAVRIRHTSNNYLWR